jgi:AcrR family transcriptional regulator
VTGPIKIIKENGRDRLIAASLRLFSLKGFHGCSIREICEAAKANISLISFHFGGKEGLLDVIFEELMDKDFNKIASLLSNAQNKEDLMLKLNLFLECYVDYSINHSDVTSLFFEELERGNSQAEDRLPSTYGILWESLKSFLENAQKQHLLNDKLDIEILAFQILSPINHLMRSRYTSTKMTLFSLKNEGFRKRLLNQIVQTTI